MGSSWIGGISVVLAHRPIRQRTGFGGKPARPLRGSTAAAANLRVGWLMVFGDTINLGAIGDFAITGWPAIFALSLERHDARYPRCR